MKQTKKLLLLISIVFIESIAAQKVIMFDLNGVLIREDKFGIAREIGLSYIIKYAVGHLKYPDIRKKMYEALEAIDGIQRGKDIEYDETEKNPLPLVIARLEKGEICHQEILKHLVQHRHDPKYTCIYDTKWEQWFIERAIKIAFDPVNLAKYVRIIPRGIDIVKKCAQEKDEFGKCKHKLVILSNMDSESFVFVKLLHPELFSYFEPENIFISGNMKMAKPEKKCFLHVLEKIKAEPEHCVFLDDQRENTTAAREMKIQTIRVKNNNYKRVERKLQGYGVL